MAQNYVLLERIELNQSASSVTFSNIPQTGYTDLKIVISSRADAGTSFNDGRMTFNGSSSGYSSRMIYGTGSATGSASNSGSYFYWINEVTTPSYTANTFNNTEIYIPNYTSSNQKSISVDSVSENNSTLAVAMLTAGLWTGTSAITSIAFTQDYGNFVSGSTFSLYGIADVNTTPAIAPKADGGNVIATDGTYWYHAFLSNGTFTPQTNLTCEYLVIGGGAGGAKGTPGVCYGGGGGAGGYTASTASVTATGYAITVGAGGAAATAASTKFNGSSSTAFSATGGGGLSGNATASSGAGGTSGSPQSYTGGSYSVQPSGGGGGAGAATTTINGGAGINTYSSWATATGTGVSGYYGGGGGGSSDTVGGTGGSGGGGNGQVGGGSQVVPTSGVANTGSGGGSMRGDDAYASGAGGSGIVIIRYLVA